VFGALRSEDVGTLCLCAGLVLGCGKSAPHVSRTGGGTRIDAGRTDSGGIVDAALAGSQLDREITPLCDGRNQLEFAYTASRGGGGSAASDLQLVLRYADPPLLFIDGQCRYYALEVLRPPAGAQTGLEFSEIRTGVLDPDTRLKLQADLRYSEWGRLGAAIQKVYDTESVSHVIDASPASMTDGRRVVRWWYDSTAPTASAYSSEQVALFFAAPSWAQMLYDQGTPLSGPVRMIVWSQQVGSTPRVDGNPAPWPLARPIWDFAVSYEDYKLKPSFRCLSPHRRRRRKASARPPISPGRRGVLTLVDERKYDPVPGQ